MKYIFKCDQCGNIFEIESTPSEISDVSIICNQCLSGKVSRRYVDVPLIFKGNGFYINDIKDKK